MSDRLHISHLKINNILGVDDLEFSPEGFNQISGKNGTGKTSVLEAIKAATGQGHDATLLRNGEEKGEVVLVLDNGTEIKRRVTPNKSQTDVTDPDGKKVTKPAEFIRGLVDTLSVNPVDFLRAPKKDRVKVLLEAMPIVVDAERLEKIVGVPVFIGEGEHGLAVIDTVRKQVYDDRTGTNRAVKEKDSTINQLRLAMPEAPGGVEGNEDELRTQVEAATTAKDSELGRIRDKLEGIKETNHAKITELRGETQKLIDEAKAECQRKIDEAVAAGQTAVESIQTTEREIEGKAAIQREKTIQKHTETVGPLNQALESIRLNRGAHAKREQAQTTIEQMEKELEDLTLDAAAQSKALADIDAYKLGLLASLPIPGVEIRDGEIYRNDVPFDRLNTAQQVGIAVEIAKLRAGNLPICCVDGLELLDPDAFEEFRKQTAESGLQLFVTRVSGEDFSVSTTAEAE